MSRIVRVVTGMGWLLAGVLAMAFSFSAWSLDLNSEIERQNSEANAMVQALDRSRGGADLAPQTASGDGFEVRLMSTKKPKKFKRARRS